MHFATYKNNLYLCIAIFFSILFGLIFGAIVVLSLDGMILVPVFIISTGIILIFWVMTEPRRVSDRLCWLLFICFICSFILWPSYISLQVPGLPWISITRIVLILMIIVWTYCIMNSSSLRDLVALQLKISKYVTVPLMIYFFILLSASLLSPDIAFSINKFLNYALYWLMVFLVSCTIMSSKYRIKFVVCVLVTLSGIAILIAWYEWYRSRIVWLDVLPPGFAADSDYVQRIISSKYRADRYRAQGTFTINLLFSEYFAIILPFAIYLLIETRGLLTRTIGFLTICLTPVGAFIADSRSGVLGVFVGPTVYIFLFGIRRWIKSKRSLIGPLMVVAYPLMVLACVVLIFTSGQIYVLMFGGGAQAASTEARYIQWSMGIPKIINNPVIGYGSGMAPAILGFFSPSGILTIDTWILSSLLESGIFGFCSFLVVICACIYYNAYMYLYGKNCSNSIGAAIVSSLVVFSIIKLVLSQPDNHTVIFIIISMTLALKLMEYKETKFLLA